MKKLLALLLAVAMIVCMFAACGKTEAAPEAEKAEEGSEAKEESAAKEETSGSEEAEEAEGEEASSGKDVLNLATNMVIHPPLGRRFPGQQSDQIPAV